MYDTGSIGKEARFLLHLKPPRVGQIVLRILMCHMLSICPPKGCVDACIRKRIFVGSMCINAQAEMVVKIDATILGNFPKLIRKLPPDWITTQ